MWDGKDRRKMNSELRDIVIEVRNDVKHIITELGTHIKQDDKIQTEIKKDLLFHQKIVYGCIGIVTFLQLIGFFHK